MRSNPRASSPATDAAGQPGLASGPADWLTQQLAVAGESAAVVFGALDTMRRIQAQAVQQVSERHAAATGKLRAGGGNDVLAVQAELLQQDLASAARCWQDLASAALETNAELWARAMHLVNTEDAFAVATRLFHA